MKKTEDEWLKDFFENHLFGFPKEIEIAQCLIDRAVEMQPVYDELNKKLDYRNQSKKCVMRAIVGTATLYGENIRDEIKIMNEKLKEIEVIAYKLSKMIENYENRESDYRRSIPNLFELIHDAGGYGTFYDRHIRKKIDEVQWEASHWIHHIPDLKDVLSALASRLYNEPEPFDLRYTREDRAVLKSQKFSYLDFVRALWVTLEESKETKGGLLPREFRLSYKAIGVSAMCVLNLSPDDANVTEDDVKKALKPVFA